jgi:hypothetical protein
MVLTILFVWIALAVLAALFLYCCSRVSNGPRRELDDDDFTTEPHSSATTRSGDMGMGDSEPHLGHPSSL